MEISIGLEHEDASSPERQVVYCELCTYETVHERMDVVVDGKRARGRVLRCTSCATDE
jgi:hypothetical protein